MSDYETGDVARVTFDFTDITGAPVDPSTVTVTVTEPDATAVVYSGGSVINDGAAVGRFYIDHPITKVGRHVAKGVSTGPASAAITRFVSVG